MVPHVPAVTRVTFVSYDDEPPLGGQGVELRGMRAALVARGHTVRTVSGRGEHACATRASPAARPLDFSLQLNRHPELIAAERGDVVHAQGGPGGVLLLRRLGAPLVYTANHTYRMAHGRALAAAAAVAARGARVPARRHGAGGLSVDGQRCA